MHGSSEEEEGVQDHEEEDLVGEVGGQLRLTFD